MAQPQWITPAGSLGTIPEGVFYSTPVQAVANGEDVYFTLIAGQLPDGVQVTATGTVEGVPKNVVRVQGVPTEVSEDVTTRFAIRAFTRNPNGTVNRLADRTFTITVTGQDVPEFVTPAGNVGTFYDGTEAEIQIQFTDSDLDDRIRIRVLTGSLPPGLVLNPRTGLISGVIAPLVGPGGTATPGYDATQYDQYPFDFSTRSASKNYQFTLEITDGKDSNARTFEIFVYSKDSMSADTTDFTADNTFITADVVPTRTPVLLTPSGDLGRVRSDNFYAFKFEATDFDGDPVEFVSAFTLPPNLTLNADTGWLSGYLIDQGATEIEYNFGVRVRKSNNPSIISDYYYFSLLVVGDIETEVSWLTDPDLGNINNGGISVFSVRAVNVGGRDLQYRLVPGSNSKLPQGLSLLTSGNIAGRVSFNTFAVDGGTTTFDKDLNTRLNIDETTFDMSFEFTVNAYAPLTETSGYSLSSLVVSNGGSGYTSIPTVTISAPPAGVNAVQATIGALVIIGGEIVSIAVDNPGAGYGGPPTVTITGGGGTGAVAIPQLSGTGLNAVSVNRTFTITVIREFNVPYESLYIKCMPPQNDRDIIDQLIENQDIIPVDLVYRSDDSNFGVAQNVTYVHAYGLTASSLDLYVQSLDLNHYWKNLTLGEIKTAQARDAQGHVLYEVVYSQIIDDLVNNQGESVDKEVTLPYPINEGDSTEIDVVYPNSLINMRDQVIDTVGQISPALPLWMTSKQSNGRVLGFTPAWVITYTIPGQSARIAYNIQENFGANLNAIDYKVDRYELDRSQTHNWQPYDDSTSAGKWIPYPPAATTFDNDTTVFDEGSTTFVSPADRWTGTDEFDKYLVFPKTNILG